MGMLMRKRMETRATKAEKKQVAKEEAVAKESPKSKTKNELMADAEALGIDVSVSMTKAEIQELIAKA